MKSSLVQKLTLYRYRYILGYGLFFVILVYLVSFAISTIPSGLSVAEMQSVASAGQLNWGQFSPSQVIDLPYHALQWLSINFLNLSTFSVRLPSVILALASGAILVLMLRRWFRDNIAIISGLMAISTVLFLTIARSGSPMIMSVFLTLLLLLAATRILHAKKRTLPWKIVACAAVALSLYSPLGIYPVLVYAAAGVLHPKVRLILRKMKPWKLIISALVAVLIATPLVWAVFRDSSVAITILGLNETWAPMESLRSIGSALFGLTEGVFAGYMTPVITMAGMIIIILGFLKTCVEFHSARSYLVLSWLVVLAPLLILDPTKLYMLFAPLVLLSAIGTETLIREWYKLFPRNPYARITGLIPLIILIGGLVYTTADRYFLANQYDAQIVYTYNQEFEAVRNAVNERSAHQINLVVAPTEVNFYNVLAQEYGGLSVTVTPNKDYDTLIITRDGYKLWNVDKSNLVPKQIVTNGRSMDALMLRIYEK